MDLCTENDCDGEMHKPPSMQKHTRTKIGAGSAASVISPKPTTPTPAPAPVAVKPAAASTPSGTTPKCELCEGIMHVLSTITMCK